MDADLCNDMNMINKVVVPGDQLNILNEIKEKEKIIAGPGLRRQAEQIIVSKPGILRYKEPNLYWVDSHMKRYIPIRGESVIGIVIQKAGDLFRVDIGSSEPASLSYLAFEGATKRNRPDVKVGDIVYAKLLIASKDMEPELVCINSHGKSGGFGVIREGGLIFQCSINLVRKLLSPECQLLKFFGKSLPYEIAIGMNGRIWLKGRSTHETIALVNGILEAEYVSNEDCKRLSEKTADKLAGLT